MRSELAPLGIDIRGGIHAGEVEVHEDDDISGLADPELGNVVAAADCPLVLMHSRGELYNMQQDIAFTNLLAEVHFELSAAVNRAIAAGVSRERLIIDPGIGFGKTAAQNLLLLRNLDCFHDFELPLLVGASRKTFIGEITAQAPKDRLAGSLAAVAWSAHHCVAIVRVHDVAETGQFLKTWQAIDRATRGQS